MLDATMELLSRPLLLVVVFLAGILLFTPYEAFLEAVLAVAMVAAAMVGSLIHPRREVYTCRLVCDRPTQVEATL